MDKGLIRFARALNIIGTLCMCAVILVCAPFTAPRALGYETYEILTGSMSPAIEPGSVVFVKSMTGDNVQAGDIITFTLDSSTDLVM
ncbi:MAG: S26 family signal peptidase, partial [Eubacterium sp.]|nr:S26 family signal peptidase [Eubacterium sp.]